jgi:UDP-2,3-diacylglucosamine pyrophosphatase LpxH
MEDLTICYLQETYLINRNKHWIRVKDWKKTYQASKTGRNSNTYLRQSRLQTYIDQMDKEGHSILIKGEIHKKEITIINIYAPNINALNFIKHTLKDLKTYINTSTEILGDFNTPHHQYIGHSNKKSIKKS